MVKPIKRSIFYGLKHVPSVQGVNETHKVKTLYSLLLKSIEHLLFRLHTSHLTGNYKVIQI